MGRHNTGVVALLFRAVDFLLRRSDAAALFDEVLQFRIGFRQFLRQWVLRRNADEARAKNRIGARGEHLDIPESVRQLFARQIESHQEALALADPVPLHDANLVWPFIQGI